MGWPRSHPDAERQTDELERLRQENERRDT